jgi:hypothetical protein
MFKLQLSLDVPPVSSRADSETRWGMDKLVQLPVPHNIIALHLKTSEIQVMEGLGMLDPDHGTTPA